ncbi:MAG TPA: TraB/GumN family protein [Caulobacteraceae bacterium]|nr:TraB/GumN family protein [Caulobacteraceae bacterium]
MGWNRRQVVAAAGLAAVARSTVFAEQAGPALWVARSGPAKVYLFGDNPYQRTPWRSPRIEAALAESTVLWRETPEGGGDAMGLFLAKGADPARPLSAWLTAKDRARVAAAAAAVRLGDAALERFRPWLAAIFLEDGFEAACGFKAQNGPTAVLTALARGAGKPIRSEFPDEAQIVDDFAGFSPAAEVGALMRAVGDIEAGPAAAERNAEAWAAGDQSLDLAAVLRMRRDFPDYYQRILVDRNRRWPARIRTMLDGGGTSFVLIGGDHLVGPDSVQRRLAAVGLEARRV